MKKRYSLMTAVILALLIQILIPAAPVSAASNWSENWDAYEVGANILDLSDWEPWHGYANHEAYVSNTHSRSGSNSMSMDPSSNPCRPFFEYDSGQWTFTVWQYIPTEFTGVTEIYLMNAYSSTSTSGNTNYSVCIDFDTAAGKVIDEETGYAYQLDLVKDEWSEIRVVIDLDYVGTSGEIGWQEVYYRDQLLYEYQWNDNSESYDSIGALEFYTGTDSVGNVYYDDLTLTGSSTPRAPSVRTHPTSQTVSHGAAVNFSATAAGYPVPTVQWQVMPVGGSWEDISGATSTTYSFNADLADSGKQFRAVFTNTIDTTINTATTNPATLTVNPPSSAPSFTSADQTTFTVGTNGTFTLSADGYPVPSITHTTGPLPLGVTYDGSTKTLSGTPATGTSGTYSLVFTASNGVNPDATQNFTLYVNGPPTIITQPTKMTVVKGNTATFTVEFTAYPNADVIWQISTNNGKTWTNIPGATFSSYTTEATTRLMNRNRFRAVISNGNGTVISDSVLLIIKNR